MFNGKFLLYVFFSVRISIRIFSIYIFQISVDEYDLREKVRHLQEYRSAGLQRFLTIKLFHKLKQNREEEMSKRTSVMDALTYVKVK